MSSIFSSSSGVSAMEGDVISKFIYLTTYWCVTRREKVETIGGIHFYFTCHRISLCFKFRSGSMRSRWQHHS